MSSVSTYAVERDPKFCNAQLKTDQAQELALNSEDTYGLYLDLNYKYKYQIIEEFTATRSAAFGPDKSLLKSRDGVLFRGVVLDPYSLTKIEFTGMKAEDSYGEIWFTESAREALLYAIERVALIREYPKNRDKKWLLTVFRIDTNRIPEVNFQPHSLPELHPEACFTESSISNEAITHAFIIDPKAVNAGQNMIRTYLIHP